MIALGTAAAIHAQWSQFGSNPLQNGSNTTISAQPLASVLADVVHDPNVPDEIDQGSGDLLIHYAAPLLDGDDVFMSYQEHVFIGPSFPITVWSVHRLHWDNGQLVDKWRDVTDWVPVPEGPWIPVMQPILANGFLYAPAAGGTILQINRTTGDVVQRINPFGSIDGSIFAAGPPTADASGNIFYGAFRLRLSNPWGTDITGSWLVRVKPDGTATATNFATLVPNAPNASAQCTAEFPFGTVQHPPSPGAVAPTITCGSQRMGLNVAPAIAPDGTIYVVSRTHFNEIWGYLVAINPDLTPKWSVSLRNRFHDGCNVLLPPTACSPGATTGVDPDDNQPGSGRVTDDSTASPVVLPDGSIIYGAYSLYNDGNGHLMHFGSDGAFLNAYPFGWDTTPAVWQHDGTYSLITKENFYGEALRPDPGEFITQLDSSLHREWQYRNPSRTSCRGNGCAAEAFGFEWCVNATAIDKNGTVYANAEDGMLYAIAQGGLLLDRIALTGPLVAAYTPVAIDAQGRIYAQTGGHLFAVGGVRPRKRAFR